MNHKGCNCRDNRALLHLTSHLYRCNLKSKPPEGSLMEAELGNKSTTYGRFCIPWSEGIPLSAHNRTLRGPSEWHHLEGGTKPRKLRSSIKQDIKTNTVVSVRVTSRCGHKHPVSVSAYPSQDVMRLEHFPAPIQEEAGCTVNHRPGHLNTDVEI